VVPRFAFLYNKIKTTTIEESKWGDVILGGGRGLGGEDFVKKPANPKLGFAGFSFFTNCAKGSGLLQRGR
jgi:hypothetical protein